MLQKSLKILVYCISVFLVLNIISCSIPTKAVVNIEATRPLMSTEFTITIYDYDQEKAETSINSAFDEIKKIESELNIFNETTEIYRLNKEYTLLNPSADLLAVIERSLYYSNISDGAFDITVQPILDLYTESFSAKKAPPTDAEIKETLKKIDYKKIKLGNNSISIGAGQRITLGGIAKGYAVEKAVEVLKKNGIEHALVNAGGNMRALGEKPGEEPWNIALQNPRDKKDFITSIELDNNAVSTSGDYERYFDENKTFHHIINPKTGYSATELISVTIVADNAFDADALSTTVFVLGKEKGVEFLKKMPDVKYLIITRDKEIIRKGI